MNFLDLLKIGIKLLVLSPEREDVFYTSRLEDVREANLLIAVPLRQGQPLILHYGDPITIRVPVEDAVIQFETTMVGDTRAPIQLYLVEIPVAWKRIQQRGYVRLPTMMSVQCRLGDPEAEPVELGITDISGSGVCLRSKDKIRMGEKIWIRLTITQRRKLKTLSVVGRVVRLTIIGTPNGDEYRLGVHFLRISPADQDFIMGFIFEKMAEIRLSQ